MNLIMLDVNEQHQALLEADGTLTIQPRQEDKDETRLTAEETYHLYVLLHEHYRSMEKTIHTNHRPFCNDLDCPCHKDDEMIKQVQASYREGEMTLAESIRLVAGMQI